MSFFGLATQDDIIHLQLQITALQLRMNSLDSRLAKVERKMAGFDDLKAEVEQVKTVEGSALTLIQGIIAKLETMPGDADFVAMVNDLKAATDPLAAAVAANTPAAPSP